MPKPRDEYERSNQQHNQGDENPCPSLRLESDGDMPLGNLFYIFGLEGDGLSRGRTWNAVGILDLQGRCLSRAVRDQPVLAVSRNLHLAGEAIPSAWNRYDIARIAGRLAERPPNHRHLLC